MIARLFVLLPFPLSVPEGENFPINEYTDAGYRVRVFPPGRSNLPNPSDDVHQVKIDGVPAFQADALRIDFHKGSFDRGKDSPLDPPEPVITRAINSFLARLRYVTRAPYLRPLNFRSATWRLQYFNDDGTELEKDEALVRGRGTLHFSVSLTVLNKDVWADVHSLPLDYEPPPWHGLLLDAQAELPTVGPALVLAATSLEVFVSHVLDTLANLRAIPGALWRWINQREQRDKEPSVEEQYDTLLRFFTSLESHPGGLR